MWIFDGESWTEENGSDRESESTALPIWDQFVPELQVIEYLPPKRKNDMPPLQLP